MTVMQWSPNTGLRLGTPPPGRISMVVPEVHTRAAMSLTNQGSGSKVSVFPRELLILSRLTPCSS